MKPKDILRIKAVQQYVERMIPVTTRRSRILRGEFVSAIVNTMDFPDVRKIDLCMTGMDIEDSTHYKRLRRFNKRCECPEFNAKATKIMEEWQNELSAGVRDVQRDGKEVRSLESSTDTKDGETESWRADYQAFCNTIGRIE